MMSLKFGENIVPNQKNENKIERGLQKTEKLVYNSDCMITSQKTSKQKQNSRGRGIFMKKSLVLVMVLALVAAFAFADEIGTAALSTDKGVVTAGEAVNVEFSLTVEDNADDVTTIEVMGDEVSDNVFVMLIKDAPNDATYEAQKVVDQDAKKTTYFIKAKELMGTMGKVYAKLVNWKNETVAEASEDFEWKNNTLTKTLSLVPPVEGLYTVMAYIEFADGTRMELKGWDGYAQLVALDNYVKSTLPGLTASLSDDAVYGSANTLTVSAGVEFMYAATDTTNTDVDPYTYFGVYGEGSQSDAPSVVWTYNTTDRPEYAEVELKYAVNGKKDTGKLEGASSPLNTDTAYIKFKVMQESFEEGDCCATAGDPKWAIWFAIGTGQFHKGSGDVLEQDLEFHVLGAEIDESYAWKVAKGAECKGWVKAIFYLDPSDVELWVTVVLGTQFEGNVAGKSFENTTVLDDENYDQNFLKAAELNVFLKTKIKDVITAEFGLLDIAVTKDAETTPVQAFAAGNIYLEGDAANIDFGGQYYITNVASISSDDGEYYWQAHAVLSGIDIDLKDFLMESLNNVRFGLVASGNQSGLSDVDIYACFEPGAVCCFPSFKIGMQMAYESEEFSIDNIFASYTHNLGEYGPVTLDGKLGVIYSMGSAIDAGAYGQQTVHGSGAYSYALGVGYEVTGTMTW
ncbi:MAG TPA: hypothetical protein PLO84_08735 [Thermotogota bacterium]|nr:hypothetical protein [Thermotogota bacterium]